MLTVAIFNTCRYTGKTTASVRLANALIQQERRVLCCDLDTNPKGVQNLTRSMHTSGRMAELRMHTLHDSRREKCEGTPFLASEMCALISSHATILQREHWSLSYQANAGRAFEEFLQHAQFQRNNQTWFIHQRYDICLLDFPSEVVLEGDALLLYALIAAQLVLIPAIDYLDRERYSLSREIAPMTVAIRLRSRFRRGDSLTVSYLVLPYDPRLDDLRRDPAYDPSLGEEASATFDYEQNTHWEYLARRIVKQYL